MSSAWAPLIAVWAIAAVAMVGGWLWQRRRDNAGIVDVLWACGLAVAAVLLAATGDGAPLNRALLALLGAAWALRLASHLWHRVSREDEDGRYRALREHWQGSQLKFFLFFQAQALLVLLFALPFLAVSRATPGSSWWAVLGAVVWLVCVAGESIADRQLARFRADPAQRGRTCREGLWRYSRHPNYFFEWLHWFSHVLLAVGSPWWGLAWLGPVLMYVFLRYLSGVPFTEQQALRTRGEDYAAYQRSTPMIFPWFPKPDLAHERSPR